jgi:hypothetical protein
VLLALLAAASAICGCAANPNPPANVAATSPPPRVVDLDDKPFDLWKASGAGHDSGRITVAIFTRTDCPISNRLAPEINRLYAQDHPRGVDFYLIYVDPHETPDSIRQHLSDYHYACTPARDPTHSLVAFCQATTTPEAALFDRDSKIVYRGRITDQYVDLGQGRPQATRHDLADAIESTLAGQPVAIPRTPAVGCAIADLKD